MHAERYPVWASLARDYLSIMASSTSSERAFSLAGITISKHRNRLKPDIIEALQYLKSTIHHGLLFCKSPSLLVERKVYSADLQVPDAAHGDPELADIGGEGVRTWDELIDDEDSDSKTPGDGLDSDDDVFVPDIE